MQNPLEKGEFSAKMPFAPCGGVRVSFGGGKKIRLFCLDKTYFIMYNLNTVKKIGRKICRKICRKR